MKYILLFSPVDENDTALDWAILDAFSTLTELYEELEKEIATDIFLMEKYAYRVTTDEEDW